MNELLDLWREQVWDLTLDNNDFGIIFDLKEQAYLALDIDDDSSISFDLSWDGIIYQMNLLEILQDFKIVGESEEDTREFSLHEFITTMYAELYPKDMMNIVNENGFKLSYESNLPPRANSEDGLDFSIDVNFAEKTINTSLEFVGEGEDRQMVYDISGFVNEANEFLRKDR